MDHEHGDLEIDDREPGEKKPGTALTRIKAVSVALSDAARRTRLSSRRVARLQSGGFAARRGARLVRRLLVGSFIAVVVLPTLAAALYFGVLASDQYYASAEFTVSAGESPYRDGIAAFTGMPAALIIQDTQIIANFIHSREMVDKLEERVQLRRRFSPEGADFFARFNPKKPIERLVKYWKSTSSVSIKLPGGIVKVGVRAFSAEDAKLVADTVVELCEELVNSLNARINRDAVALAETGFRNASERLSRTLAKQELARNESGILDSKISAEVTTGMIRQLQQNLLTLSGDYETQLKYMGPETPQMRELKSRIDVMREQVVRLEGELTAPRKGEGSGSGAPTLAAAMVTFGALEAEQKADVQLYENAATALEHARVAAEHKMIYLKVFVRPSLPEESEYPMRGLDVFLVAIGSLALWGLLTAIGAAVRNNLA